MQIINSIAQALLTSFSMFWEILWPLILGFTLSGIVQSLVSHQAMFLWLRCYGEVVSASSSFPILERSSSRT